MQERIRRDLIPVEINVTDTAIPEGVPGLAPWVRALRLVPGYRLGFSNIVILDPSGTFRLGWTGCNHGIPQMESIAYHPDRFLDFLAECLDRHRAVREGRVTDPSVFDRTPVRNYHCCGGDVRGIVAAYGVDRVGREIVATFADPDPAVRAFVVRRLGQIGPPAKGFADAVRELLRDSDHDVRRGAAWTLERLTGVPPPPRDIPSEPSPHPTPLRTGTCPPKPGE